MKSSFFHMILFLLLSLSLMGYMSYHWHFKDLYDQIKLGEKQQAQLQLKINSFAQQLILLEEEVQAFNTFSSALNVWQKKLIARVHLFELLTQIRKISYANHLQIAFFEAHPPYRENSYFKMPVIMRVVGHYHQLANFISQIANLPWLVVIDHFDMVRNNSLQEDTYVTANLNLEIYYLAKK